MIHRGGGKPVPAPDQKDQTATTSAGTPPGTFVSPDHANDCARFLADLRRRSGRAEEKRPPSKN